MIDTIEVTASELAETLGISDRRVRQLAKEGTVVRGAQRGRYALQESVRQFLKTRERQQDTASLDALREERLKGLQIARAVKDRELIALEEAVSVIDDVTGVFVSALAGMPARITNDVRERRRLDAIFDAERQRLADLLSEKCAQLVAGR